MVKKHMYFLHCFYIHRKCKSVERSRPSQLLPPLPLLRHVKIKPRATEALPPLLRQNRPTEPQSITQRPEEEEEEQQQVQDPKFNVPAPSSRVTKPALLPDAMLAERAPISTPTTNRRESVAIDATMTPILTRAVLPLLLEMILLLLLPMLFLQRPRECEAENQTAPRTQKPEAIQRLVIINTMILRIGRSNQVRNCVRSLFWANEDFRNEKN